MRAIASSRSRCSERRAASFVFRASTNEIHFEELRLAERYSTGIRGGRRGGGDEGGKTRARRGGGVLAVFAGFLWAARRRAGIDGIAGSARLLDVNVVLYALWLALGRGATARLQKGCLAAAETAAAPFRDEGVVAELGTRIATMAAQGTPIRGRAGIRAVGFRRWKSRAERQVQQPRSRRWRGQGR